MATSKGAVLYLISIHAPPRGATGGDAGKETAAGVFQFTPLREGRPKASIVFFVLFHFNSRPSARGDLRPADQLTSIISHFNSRPSARGDVEDAERFAADE